MHYFTYENCAQFCCCCCFCCSCCCYIIITTTTTTTATIYNYITETNHVSRVQSVAAVLYLQFGLHVMLFHPWNMFCTFTLALSVLFVQGPMWQFFLYFLNFMLSWYVSQVLSWVILKWSHSPVITGITCAFTFHMHWISIIRSVYFKTFSASFLITFL